MKPQQLVALVALLVVASIAIVVAPIAAPNNAFSRKVAPRLGLDIQGGARVVLEAEIARLPNGQRWTDDTRQAVLRTIENRVNANGVAEPVITPKGDHQFVVEIPAVKNNSDIIEQLQKTAQLEFYYSPDWLTQRNPLGRYQIEPKVDGGARESYVITDRNDNKTFRDRFHVNLDLRAAMDAADRESAKAVETPLPSPLETLAAAAGSTSVKLLPADAGKLEGFADELRRFDTFLSESVREMDGSDLQPGMAKANFSPGGSGGLVELEFSATGRDKFSRFTRDHTNEVLMIYLDGRILMAPNINEPITNGRAQISPFASLKEAKALADYLNGGSLPVPLRIVQQQSIEATLGTEAVRQGLVAGIAGLLGIIVFMLWHYRLPGAVASVSLILYSLFTYTLFVLIPVTFTLPGIAGFILSVGMAIDANILIFERTKEELRDGQTLQHSIRAGFQRAFSAIFDSNLCTAVTSIFLYNFGTGAVRGFALTLLLGVALSMFTAITVTRTFLLLMVGSKGGRPDAETLRKWSGDKIWRPTLNVVNRRNRWYALSAAVIVPGVVFAAMGGFKLGIDFTGGSELTLQFAKPVTRTQVEAAFKAQGIGEAAAQVAGGNTVYVRLPKPEGKAETSAPEAAALVEKLQAEYPGTTLQGFERIGSSISAELTRNALTSIVFSSLFIVFYLAFRFAIGGFANGIKFGIAAIIAMLHDTAALIGAFCVLGYFLNWKIDAMFVTAALTVIGFSVHDTIVIFDRIRENLHLRGGKMPFPEIVAHSINETFARSVFTSLTVVITLVALLIFGGPVIRPLNAALLIGILSGTFSSIFNAAPIVVDWQRLFGKASDKSLGSTARSGS
jgi:SecD/SecF fusion protein